MFVILDDNVPASSTNAFALSIRDRLLAAAVATQGVEVGWQQGRSGAAWNRHRRTACTMTCTTTSGLS